MRWFPTVAFIVVAGCSSHKPSNEAPLLGDPIGIVIPAGEGLPKLFIRVAFSASEDPGPHVAPLATIIANARATCFAYQIDPNAVAVVSANLHAKTLNVTSRNAAGACLGTALDGKPIEDAAELAMELRASTAVQ